MDETNELTNTTESTEQNYIDTIKKLKENSVEKDKYNKVIEENKQLLKALTESRPPEQKEEAPKVDIQKLRKELYENEGKGLTNLQYIEKTLELRKALLEETGEDFFVKRTNATQQDYERAEKTATILQECVDFARASGDSNTGDSNISNIFNAELQRRLEERKPIPQKNNFRR